MYICVYICVYACMHVCMFLCVFVYVCLLFVVYCRHQFKERHDKGEEVSGLLT